MIQFFSFNIWRKLFILKKNKFLKPSEKYIYSRASKIPKCFERMVVYIHNGKLWQKKYVYKWMVGYKFGNFAWNKKIALFKAKQLKKKKK